MGCPIHGSRADVPANRVSAFNYRTDAAMVSDPWVALHGLGAGPGLFYSNELGGHWCAAKRETVIGILRNWELFSSKSIRVPPVERAVASGEPAHVAKYAFQLAQSFNNFYHQYHILHEENREKKVFLLWMTDFFREQLERTLDILGIRTPDYM